MAGNFLVVGLGAFGSQVVKTLFAGGAFVLAVDRLESRVNAVRDVCSKAVGCDATDEQAMRAVGAYEMEVAIVAIRNAFGATVLITHALKKQGVPAILVQVDNEHEAEAVLAVGATEVIFPPRDMALRIANKLLHPDLAERIPLGRDVALIDIPCPARFAGQTIGGLALRTHYGVNLVGLRVPAANQRVEEVRLNPPPDTRLEGHFHLLLLGELGQLAQVKALPRRQEDRQPK